MFAELSATLAYCRTFARFARARLWLAVGLMVLIGLFEGSGLLVLLPLLRSVGFAHLTPLRGFARFFASPFGMAGNSAALPAVLAVFVGIKAAQAALRAWSDTLNRKLETDFVCHLRERFYRALIRANWLHVARLRSSDITQTLISEYPIVGNGVQQALRLLSVIILAAVQIAVVVMLSAGMTALALAAGALVGLGLHRLRQHSLALARLGYGKRTEMAAAVTEHLAGMKIAKSHGREAQHFEHFRDAMNEIADHTMQTQRVAALTNAWLQIGAVAALAFFVWFAVRIQHVDSATLLMLAFIFTRLLTHMTSVQSIWHQIEQARPSYTVAEALRHRLNAAAEPPVRGNPRRIQLRNEIRLESLSFRYDPTQPGFALRNIDLAVPARQVTAVCGVSGAGKSTLADILLGLLVPESGRLLIDGAPLTGDRLHDWRHSIGYVPQETFLFHESVRNNLLWAQPQATESDLRAALKAAAAEDFVGRLPNQLDTVVGDRGFRLSGGERQRIALARALLRHPTLLVLDEATSSLDTHNERLVQDAIERLQGEITLVVIAHRLSTVRFADRIVVLSSGQVAEMGSWDELNSRTGGVFHQLVRAGST